MICLDERVVAIAELDQIHPAIQVLLCVRIMVCVPSSGTIYLRLSNYAEINCAGNGQRSLEDCALEELGLQTYVL